MTTKITSLSEIWEQYLNEPVKPSIQFTRESVQVTASNQMNTTDNAYNDMYKSSIFKKLWNHNIIHFGDHEVVADTSPLQKDMFAHLDDYPESEANTVIFNNGSLTTVSNWRNLFQIWSGQSAGGIVDQAFNSLVGYSTQTMPGTLASRLTESVQVLNIDSSCKVSLTADPSVSNEASLKESAHWSIKDADESILNSGVYLVRICKNQHVVIDEIHTGNNKFFCNKWIYVVDYGASLTINRHADMTDGVIDSTHIIQYPKSNLTINTYDTGNQWRNINITAYQSTTTNVNGSTLLKNSDSANFIDVHHKGYDGNSNIKYNSAIYNSNTGNFIGEVRVEKKAVGTKSEMTNKNLLVDPLSRAFSKPVLHINTKEIECTHGCTTSKISEDEIYYLESLGVDSNTAKTIIANGHIQI
jgi:hypothetical protein|tara:strand:- start:79 stop:1320 length:1242 start_codon:yes stop_codon:yes gene_type:complete